MIDPKVQRHGDVALLTFNLVNYGKLQDAPERVLARWNSTEVYSWIGGTWKIADGFLTFTCRRSAIYLIGAAEASQHDGRTHDVASSEPRTMAGVAGKAPYVKSGGLARVPQGPHRGEVDSLRRHRS